MSDDVKGLIAEQERLCRISPNSAHALTMKPILDALSTLSRERDEARAERDRWCEQAQAAMKALAEEDDEARASEASSASKDERIAKLEAALAPFAEESLFAGPQHEFVTVKLSACDAARATLNPETPDDL